MIPLISHSEVDKGDQIATVTTYQGAMSLQIHAMGFLEIAAVAAKASLKHETAIDSITPSIIYAIRHATELFVKHVIVDLVETHPKDRQPMKYPKGHNVLELFNARRADIEFALDYEAEHHEHTNFDRRKWLADMEAIVVSVDAVDPDGQTLRYPTKLDGVTPNLGGTMCISMMQLEAFARHAVECFAEYTMRCC